MQQDNHRSRVQQEFSRTAASFGERTLGRFDHMGVVEFSGAEPGSIVMEVGGGTGNFLSLFETVASRLIVVDLTEAMLLEARRLHSGLDLLIGVGEAIPLRDGAVDLSTCAQMVHHVPDPVPLLKELGRVTRKHVLVVDQISTENDSETALMTESEILRDPSHSASRPPSVYRELLAEAGLEIVNEAIRENEDTFSSWMRADEFPAERVEAVRQFIEEHSGGMGMDWRLEDGEWHFTRRRIMLLARPFRSADG
jgi:ubiquinone/menaquinone biosynthesis C-methylase UbiE